MRIDKASLIGVDGSEGFTSVNPASIILNGSTDASTALQAELDRIGALGGGTLKLISYSGIKLASDVTIGYSNVKLDLYECPVYRGTSGGKLGILGTTSTSTNLTGNVAAGALSVAVTSATGLAKLDYALLLDDETAGDASGYTDSNVIHREVVRITGISTLTVTVDHFLVHALTTAKTARLTKLSAPINSSIVGAKMYFTADGTTNDYGFYMKYAVDCDFIDCEVRPTLSGSTAYGCYDDCFRFEQTYRCRRIGCVAEGVPTDVTYGSGQCYGFTDQGTMNKTLDCVAINTRHGFLHQNGACLFETAYNMDISARVSAYDLHGLNARKGHIHDNIAIGGPLLPSSGTTHTGVRIGNSSHPYGDHDNVIEDNVITGYDMTDTSGGASGGRGVGISVPSTGNIVQNNTIIEANLGIDVRDTSGYLLSSSNNTVRGNVILRATGNAINIDGDTAATGTNHVTYLNLIENETIACTKHYHISNTGNTNVVDNKVIKPTASSGEYAFTCINNTALLVSRNMANGANKGISIKSCPLSIADSNELLNQLETEVFKDDTSSGNNNGFIFTNNSYAGTATPLITIGASTGYTISDYSPTTTKGDIIVRGTTQDARLAVGANGYAPIADSGATNGLAWYDTSIRPKIPSAKYLATPIYGAVSISTFSNGIIYFAPIYVKLRTTFTDFGIAPVVCTATNYKVGIYADLNGAPTGNPVTNSTGTIGPITVAAVTQQNLTFGTPVPLATGWYWLAILKDTSGTDNSASANFSGLLTGLTDLTTSVGDRISYTQAYASGLPDMTSNTVTRTSGSTTPFLGLKTQ